MNQHTDIIELLDRPEIDGDARLKALYTQLHLLLEQLRQRPLPDAITGKINQHIQSVNAAGTGNSGLKRAIRQQQSAIVRLLEKELKIVPRHHYRNFWLAVGMSAFGLPIGVAFGTALGNMGLLGIGLPIGMAIGVAVGMSMDKKAASEGRQLDMEIK